MIELSPVNSDVLSRCLSQVERDDTVAAISLQQCPSGIIPWSASQHSDPWNHTEAAMALTVGEEFDRARRAYEWLAENQSGRGSWCSAYWPDGSIKDRRIDTNTVAYIATGVLHFYRSTNDTGFARHMFGVVERALDFVTSLQLSTGAISWSIDAGGTASRSALLAGSSSIFHSLVAGSHLAASLGIERDHWQQTAAKLRFAINSGPELFLDKSAFAMDWYYPVLTGALDNATGKDRLSTGEERYVLSGKGVLCRSDRRWVTTAETAEYAIALFRVGKTDAARSMLDLVQHARDEKGNYSTGIVYPEAVEFPRDERTTYSAAAVLLADAVGRGDGATSSIFDLAFDESEIADMAVDDDTDELYEGACA